MSVNDDLVKNLTQFVQRLAQGDIDADSDLTSVIPGLSAPELAELNQALDALRQRLKNISQMVGQVAEGDLSVRVAPVSAQDELGLTLARALGNLRRTFAQVLAGTEALGSAESLLADTANQTGDAVDETVGAFGKVTANTFDQFSGISQANTGLAEVSKLLEESGGNPQLAETVKKGIDTVNDASEANAKITVGIRLTTNRMLEQVDKIVVTSRSLRGMTLGLQDTMAPYILASEQEKAAALKIAYLPITDHLVLPLTHLQQVQQSEGQPIEIMRCGSWPALVDSLEEKADGALILAPLAIKLFEEGLPIRSIMAAHRNGSGLVLKKGLDSIDDVAGHTIAVPDTVSTHSVLLYKALQRAGIPYDAVEVRSAPPPLMPYFLQRGTIDGFISADPFPEVALSLGAGRLEFLSKDLIPNHMCCVLVMREEVLENEPDKVIQLVRSFVQAGKKINEDPARAARDVSPFFGVAPNILNHVLTTPPDRITYDRLELFADEFYDFGNAMVEMGLLTEQPDVEGLLDSSYYKEAMK